MRNIIKTLRTSCHAELVSASLNKRFQNKFIMTIFLGCTLVFMLSSCSNIFIGNLEQSNNKNAYFMIAPENIAIRTAGPTEEYALENLTSLTLSATKTKKLDGTTVNGTKRQLASGGSYPLKLEGLYNKQFLLEDGEGWYTIELQGQIDGIYFYDNPEIEVKLSQTNLVTFELHPVKAHNKLDESYDDFGGLSFTMKFNTTDVSKIDVKLELLDYEPEDPEDPNDNGIIDTKSITSFSSGKATYQHLAKNTSGTETRIPTGTYRVTLDFYCKDTVCNDFVLRNSFPFIVNVEKGRNTYIEETFELDPVYTITYKDNGGSIADGEVKRSKFTRKDEITLPFMKQNKKSFKGWYTDKDFAEDTKITEIEKGTIGNQTVYAKFVDSVIYVNTNGKDDEYDGLSNTVDTSNGQNKGPVRTLTGAINKIKEANDSSLDWYIYISDYNGAITGSHTIADDRSGEVPLGFPAKSITIVGGNSKSSGSYQDMIKGNGTAPVLNIASTVPVTIKYLKITGGTCGIYSGYDMTKNESVDSRLTLGTGTLITGNTNTSTEDESKDGAGLIVGGGFAWVESGAVIENNISNGNGAGIFVKEGSDTSANYLYIDGGTVQNNTIGSGQFGSDIYVSYNSRIIVSGKTIIGDVYLYGSYADVELGDNLTKGASITITPQDYDISYYESEGEPVVYATQLISVEYDSGIKISDNNQYFHVTPQTPGSDIWFINEAGELYKYCNVTFTSTETNQIFTKTLTYAEKLGEPDDTLADREDYKFAGWFKSTDSGKTLTEKVSSEDYVFEDLSLYAKWVQPIPNLYVDPTDGSDDNIGTEASKLKTVSATVDKIRDFGEEYKYTIHVSGMSTEGSVTIYDDIIASSITFIGDANNDYGISISSALEVNTSAPVVFENFVIQFTGHSGSTRDALALSIGEEANVSLTQKTKIYAGSGVTGEAKGGVYLEGTLTMEDSSEIYGLSPSKSGQNNNGGGGVWIQGGHLIMNDNSSIHSCYADNMGGAIYLQSGEVIMNDNASIGGEGKGCSANNNGGAVYMEDGTFEMNDNSSISYCSKGTNGAGSVWINNGTFTMNGGSIHHNTGGVEVSATAKETYVYSGTFIMKSGSISNNTGIGVCVDAACKNFSGSNGSTKTQKASGVFDMQGGTISDNTENGVKVEAVVSDSPYHANSGTFKMSESAVVDESNDVLLCYYKRGNEAINDFEVAQAKIKVTGSLDGNAPAIKATITPQNYESGLQVLEAAEGVNLESEYDFFDVTPKVTGETPNTVTVNWFINEKGKLEAPPIGNKPAPNAVGDIVFFDGTAMAYSENMELTDTQKNAAVAIIFYKGTDLNSPDENGNEVRTLGVGLKHGAEYKWSELVYNKRISSIICEPSKYNNYVYQSAPTDITFSGDKNGNDNFEQILKYVKDNNLENATAENCPAFYFAENYKNTAKNIAGTACEKGWYIPSIAELYHIWYCIINTNEGVNINTVSSLLAGDQFGSNEDYWSSSQNADENLYHFAYYIKFDSNDLLVNGSNKTNPMLTCVIREF